MDFRIYSYPLPLSCTYTVKKSKPYNDIILTNKNGNQLVEYQSKKNLQEIFLVKGNDSFKILFSYCSHDNSV